MKPKKILLIIYVLLIPCIINVKKREPYKPTGFDAYMVFSVSEKSIMFSGVSNNTTFIFNRDSVLGFSNLLRIIADTIISCDPNTFETSELGTKNHKRMFCNIQIESIMQKYQTDGTVTGGMSFWEKYYELCEKEGKPILTENSDGISFYTHSGKARFTNLVIFYLAGKFSVAIYYDYLTKKENEEYPYGSFLSLGGVKDLEYYIEQIENVLKNAHN